MSVSLWRIGTDTADYEAHDLSGKGAEKTGGRWNRPGRPVIYTASSPALACLETVVHVVDGRLPLNRFLVRIDVPQELWNTAAIREASRLPVGWTAVPTGKVSLDIGDRWLLDMKAALLVVPSVIVPEEFNALINPKHPQAKVIVATKLRPWLYDQRFRP